MVIVEHVRTSKGHQTTLADPILFARMDLLMSIAIVLSGKALLADITRKRTIRLVCQQVRLEIKEPFEVLCTMWTHQVLLLLSLQTFHGSDLWLGV